MVNLHIHSNCSDGVQKPKDLLLFLKQNGITIFSITDHDNVDAYKEINDKNLIPGVELSADFYGGICHILGYGIDLKVIDNFCQKLKKERIKKGHQMIKILKDLGYIIDIDIGEKIIGRREICNYLIKKNYFKTYEEAKKTLFIEGKPCYIKLQYPKIEECIDTIHKSNGVAVIAHPWTLNLNNDDLEKFLNHYNFDGIEVFNHNISFQLYQSLKVIADKNGLYKTCGTDYHGYEGFNDILITENIDCGMLLKKLKRND